MSESLFNVADTLSATDHPGASTVLREQTLQKSADITRTLQTTLDPSRLIELFSMEVGSLIVHQGVRYRNEDLDLDLKLGRQARHACTYRLNIGDEPLGKLTFRRNRKFNEAEFEALEQLLCSLLYPLRNALLYQDALQLAQKDPLTGVSNRSALDESLQCELSHARRHDSSCALLVLDIDHFKAVNDRYGHIVGDGVLRDIAARIGGCKRDGDLLFRYGGEEFVVLLRDTGEAGARLLAERIRSCIENSTCHCSGAELRITLSIGVSVLRDDDTPESLFARADQALYQAKRSGRNRVCVAD